ARCRLRCGRPYLDYLHRRPTAGVNTAMAVKPGCRGLGVWLSGILAWGNFASGNLAARDGVHQSEARGFHFGIVAILPARPEEAFEPVALAPRRHVDMQV